MVGFTLTVNGLEEQLHAETHVTLLDVLRDQLELRGAKQGCDRDGECGTCTVLVDGQPLLSCLLLACSIDGAQVETVENLGTERSLHPLQQAFWEAGAVQCGFCTPAMLLSAKALLEQESAPTEQEIRLAINGVLCRCTGYAAIVRAIANTAKGATALAM
jgi:aerobic-type carbon monoxide dehydrogenase small subunit (CoxS/CutS family)